MKWLAGRTIAVSVSAPNDLAEVGMGPEHLHDAIGEISRQLLAVGARLMYGGDLREGGITRVLFELAARYAPPRAGNDSIDPLIIDVVPYPMHAGLSAEEIVSWEAEFSSVAELRFMNPEGDVWSYATRPNALAQMSTADWPAALTAMREYVTRNSSARIVLGGATAGYLGRMPGVEEEVFISARAGQPVFVIGGFGGAASTIARSISEDQPVVLRADDKTYYVKTKNGLEGDGLRRLATSPHIDEISLLLTRGLAALFKHAD